MKAVVTGGAGFIGSHIAEALCRRGAEVAVLDDFRTGSRDNLAWKRDYDSLHILRGDICDPDICREALHRADWVFHHAAIASVPASVADPVGTNRVNLDATLQLLLSARDAGVTRFVFASSSAVYGDSASESKIEGQEENPASPYGLQKLAGEKYGAIASSLWGVPCVSLRYFNVFGPRQSFNSAYSGVIARFCTSILKGEPSTIYGDGGQSRDFIHISNVVEANLAAAEAPVEKVAGRSFNIGSGRSTTIRELYNTIARLAGSNAAPVHEPARPGDIRHSRASIERAREAFGYEPKTSFEDGLLDTLHFYRQSGNAQ